MIHPAEKFVPGMSIYCPELVNTKGRLDMLHTRVNHELKSIQDTLRSSYIDNAAIAQITTGIITEQVRQYQPRQEKTEWRLIHPIWYGQETCGHIYFEESDNRQHVEIECVTTKQLLDPSPESLSDQYQVKLFIEHDQYDLSMKLNDKVLDSASLSKDELIALSNIFSVIEIADYAPLSRE